jgi:hypothetical protein
MSVRTNPFTVKVVAGENGDVIQQNPNKAEYGSIMLEQPHYSLRNGFLNARRKVGFIAGTMEELGKFSTAWQLKNGAELPGKLYVVEQFTPFYEDQQPKINPATGRAILVDGAMVYSKTFYDESGNQGDIYQTGEISEGDVITEPKVNANSVLRNITLS